jgi:plastocyanin
MIPKKIVVLFAVLVLALMLAACGGGGGGGDAAPEPVALSFSGFDEFRYDPATASVPTGAEVTVNFANEGALEHDWMLVPEGTDVNTVTAENALMPEAHSGVLPAGETNSFTFTAPAPGTYQYVCTVAGHAPGGMVGTLTVTE